MWQKVKVKRHMHGLKSKSETELMYMIQTSRVSMAKRVTPDIRSDTDRREL